jgi:hypothetical protein
MKLAIMQPYFFPYIGYFQLINAVEKFIIYDDVNYIKGGWINRNNILINNKSYLFTVPLENLSSFQQINHTILHPKLYPIWKTKFLKTLEQSYKKAPYYNNVINLVENVLNTNTNLVSKLASESIIAVCDYLDINTQIIKTSEDYKNQELKGQERIISLCKIECANYYINPIGGIDLYSKEDFKKQEITLNFIKSSSFEYNQFGNEFIPWLSIIDILMFNDVSDVKQILNQYELI